MFGSIKKLSQRKNGDPRKDPKFIEEYKKLRELGELTRKRFSLNESDFYPCLHDNTPVTGFDRHYIYHPAWAARIIREISPEKHIDISSTLYFSSILSAFIPVDFYDYRPANLVLNNLKSAPADLLALPFATNSIESLSCMHTVEHIGLGRYGDPLDYDGDIKAVNELKRVLIPGGHLIFVLPIGSENRILFNAHRIYTKQHVLDLFSDLRLQEFVLIPEDEKDGGLIVNPNPELLKRQVYACGCFYFTKE